MPRQPADLQYSCNASTKSRQASAGSDFLTAGPPIDAPARETNTPSSDSDPGISASRRFPGMRPGDGNQIFPADDKRGSRDHEKESRCSNAQETSSRRPHRRDNKG